MTDDHFRSDSPDPRYSVDPGFKPPESPMDVLPVKSADSVAPTVKAVQPPQLGFWLSLAWTIAYGFVLPLVVGIGAGIVAMAVILIRYDNPADYLSKLQTPAYQKSSEFNELNLLSQVFTLCVAPIVGVLLALGLIRWTAGKQWRRKIALYRPKLVHLLLAALGLPALVYLDEAAYRLAILVHLPTFNYQEEIVKLISQMPPWFGVMTIGLGAPIAEELFFRGFLGRGLVAHYGRVRGVLLTSMFFSIMHLDPPHIVATFVLGAGFHYAYLMTRSLWVPISLHVLNNSISVLMVTLLKETEVSQSSEVADWLMCAPSLLLACAVGWALYRSRARLASSTGAAQPAWQPVYPGVQYPPPESDTTVVHPSAGWASLTLVAAAAAVFAVAFYFSTKL
jgi:membrane protease YdiL (CAAX protease family)